MSKIEVNVEELRTAICSFQMELEEYKSVANNYKTSVDKFSDMNSNFCIEMKKTLECIKTESTEDIVLEIENYIKSLQVVVDEFCRVDDEEATGIQGSASQRSNFGGSL